MAVRQSGVLFNGFASAPIVKNVIYFRIINVVHTLPANCTRWISLEKFLF
jgi:hypothetical protein